MPEKPLTTTQAAALLGVSPATIVDYAEKGYLAHYRLPGGHRRFRREDVEALKQHSVPAGGDAA